MNGHSLKLITAGLTVFQGVDLRKCEGFLHAEGTLGETLPPNIVENVIKLQYWEVFSLKPCDFCGPYR